MASEIIGGWLIYAAVHTTMHQGRALNSNYMPKSNTIRVYLDWWAERDLAIGLTQCDQILELKVAQFPLKVAPKVGIAILPKKLRFLNGPKSYLTTRSSFWNKICYQIIPKIVQSVHTSSWTRAFWFLHLPICRFRFWFKNFLKPEVESERWNLERKVRAGNGKELDTKRWTDRRRKREDERERFSAKFRKFSIFCFTIQWQIWQKNRK